MQLSLRDDGTRITALQGDYAHPSYGSLYRPKSPQLPAKDSPFGEEISRRQSLDVTLNRTARGEGLVIGIRTVPTE